MVNFLVSTIAKIAIVLGIILVFLFITILNIKIKKPDYDSTDPDSPCFSCAKKSSCFFINKEDDEDLSHE